MSGQVRWKGRFIKNKTLDYEVRRNSALVTTSAEKRKYSAVNSTYASKLVVCVENYSRQTEEREECCRVAILLRLSV